MKGRRLLVASTVALTCTLVSLLALAHSNTDAGRSPRSPGESSRDQPNHVRPSDEEKNTAGSSFYDLVLDPMRRVLAFAPSQAVSKRTVYLAIPRDHLNVIHLSSIETHPEPVKGPSNGTSDASDAPGLHKLNWPAADGLNLNLSQHSRLLSAPTTNEYQRHNEIDISKNNSVEKSASLRMKAAKSEQQCARNKYDKLIADKIRLNSLSQPIVKANGEFDCPFPGWKKPSPVDGLASVMTSSDESGVPSSKDELDRLLPVLEPNFTATNPEKYRVTWMGHSTLLIQINGLNILTDPIFSDRASFTQFIGPKRIRPPPCSISQLPRIDIVLISHNHFDHLDTNSVEQLNARFGTSCRWIVPLGLADYMKSMKVENFVELDWWQRDCYEVINDTGNQLEREGEAPEAAGSRKELNIYMTPAQHWCRRGISDYNRVLWGSFVIVDENDSKFFFNGDTGYCSAFKEINSVFGSFAGAAIPIGAYKPRWFLKAMHVDPEEATQIHQDLNSKKSISIHHSTFILSYEHYLEPTLLLNETMQKVRGEKPQVGPFISLKHGESTEFDH